MPIVVTVNVVTYNSAKFILETLESIKNQTYSKIALAISDDHSNDNTVELCENWINKNKNRFVETKIILTDKNTGVSGNFNRLWDACTTEWMKDIAGDDLLLPNCISDFVDYIKDNPNATIIFSRVSPFYISHGKTIWEKESWHDYSFFNLTPSEQYHYLIYKGNNLPAPSCFYNIKRLRQKGIRNDERIPLLEDYPKWIMCLRKGITFHFMDKHTVGYRQDISSLSVGVFSPNFYKSNLLFYLYYYQDEIGECNSRENIYNLMCDKAIKFYISTYNRAINSTKTLDYKIGHTILSPFRLLIDIARYIRSVLFA